VVEPALYLAPCTHAEARAAVRCWHYSRRIGTAVKARYGVWEGGRFVGCVLFNNGANPQAGAPYGLPQHETAELIRVALGPHEAPTSRVVGIAVRLFRRAHPGVRLLVSYADPDAGHVGTLYQACGWLYVGRSCGTHVAVLPTGERVHKKSLRRRCGHNNAYLLGGAWAHPEQKHKYLLPLDEDVRRRVAPLSRPYPRCATSIGGDAPADQAGEGGSSPTVALSAGHVWACRPLFAGVRHA
jgi:hypothetical protein